MFIFTWRKNCLGKLWNPWECSTWRNCKWMDRIDWQTWWRQRRSNKHCGYLPGKYIIISCLLYFALANLINLYQSVWKCIKIICSVINFFSFTLLKNKGKINSNKSLSNEHFWILFVPIFIIIWFSHVILTPLDVTEYFIILIVMWFSIWQI